MDLLSVDKLGPLIWGVDPFSEEILTRSVASCQPCLTVPSEFLGRIPRSVVRVETPNKVFDQFRFFESDAGAAFEPARIFGGREQGEPALAVGKVDLPSKAMQRMSSLS